LMLDLFSYRKRCHHATKLLVLVPCIPNIAAWSDEVTTHAPNLTTGCFTPDVVGERRLDLVTDPAIDICIMTYAGCLRMMSSGGGGKGLMLNPKKSKIVTQAFDFVVYDESTFMGKHTSKYFKMCKVLSKAAKFRYGLTGTPFGNDLHILWSQYYSVDFGETFGETVGLFRGAFFKASPDFWSKGFTYTFDKSKTQDLHRFMHHKGIRYAESECQDLPEAVKTTFKVTFPKENWEYYSRAKEEYENAWQDFSLLESSYTRLRQLASGYLIVKDGQEDRHTVVFKENPKIDMLLELIDETPEATKVIVFHDFVKTGEIISEHLKAHKIKHARLFSGAHHKDQIYKDFKENPKTKVLVANQSAAFGLNLQIAKYAMFFESVSDPIIRQQMVKRIHRGGQLDRVFIYDIVVKGSIEERILKALQEGKDFFTEVVEGRAKL